MKRKKTKEYGELVKNIINDQKFLEAARKTARDFTRSRKLPFGLLCMFLLRIVHECLTKAFQRFAADIGVDMNMREQSLSEARNKIRWEAFRELSERVSEFAYRGGYDRWNGYRVWAIDGSEITLPNIPKLAAVFGSDNGSPTARASVLYDVINHTVFDGLIEPLSVGERDLAIRHANRLIEKLDNDKELLILDRGYPSAELIEFFSEKELSFLMRVKRKFNCDVDAAASNDIVRIGEVNVRVVKVTLDSGETETLLTNLTEDFDFKALYYLRWGVEKEFYVLKNTLEIENFSGRTETAIRQDFYIHIIASNFLAASFWEAQEKVDAERNTHSGNKYKYKVNVSQAAGTMRDYLIPAMLTNSIPKRNRLYRKMHRVMADAVVPVRPNRIVPRKLNNRRSEFHHNKKPNL